MNRKHTDGKSCKRFQAHNLLERATRLAVRFPKTPSEGNLGNSPANVPFRAASSTYRTDANISVLAWLVLFGIQYVAFPSPGSHVYSSSAPATSSFRSSGLKTM